MPSPPVDPARTLTLVCASIQTYSAYNAGAAFSSDPLNYITPPPGTRYVDSWNGQDVFDGNRTHELVLFGLIFEYIDDPGRFIFAFRGTKGIHEWIDDIKVAHASFKPETSDPQPAVPKDVCIEEGFDEIYSSMQGTLFAKLDALQPKLLEITGHSLGSSLATLFTLDVVLSRPDQAYVSENFASPRVGNAHWAAYYESLTTAKGQPTLRVVNTKDLVPKVPPAALGYKHIGEAYDICFESPKGVLPNFGLRHSADNYEQVLSTVFGVSCDCRLEVPKVTVKICTP